MIKDKEVFSRVQEVGVPTFPMNPRVENLPRLLDRSLYAEAMEMYLDLSFRYIDSLYTFGSIRYPGLSDIDLLVVPKENYLAPLKLSLLDRLPSRFDCILEHNVYVVPQSHFAAFAVAHPHNLDLLYGKQSLDQIAKDSSIAGRLCMALEHLCNAIMAVEEIESQQVINATSRIRVFSAFRYAIRRLSELEIGDEDGYGTDIDELILKFINTPSEQHVLSMFHRYKAAVRCRVGAVATRLGIDVRVPEQILALPRGAKPLISGFRTEDAERRYQTIAAYHAGLAERNFYYGSMFLSTFHPRAPLKSFWFRVLRKGAHLLYRGKRRYQNANHLFGKGIGP
jgi:hypothetical protein